MKQEFDFSSIDDFDKHISLSIPNYDGLIDTIKPIFTELMPTDGLCVDIGCSTGKLIGLLSKEVRAHYTGVDVIDIRKDKDINFYAMDCADYLAETEYQDFIFSIFTMQFLQKHKREKVVEELARLVNYGAKVIIAEKVYCVSSKIDSIIRRSHIQKKRDYFTSDEIIEKELALSQSMSCLDEDEIYDELRTIGKPTQIWQSYNFHAWVIM